MAKWYLPKGLDKDWIDIAGHIDHAVRLEVDGHTLEGNMQETAGAFDAWALVFRTFFGSQVKIQLALKDGVKLPEWPEGERLLLGKSHVHYNRFLYRLMKFDQFYGGPDGWFKIADPSLAAAAARFRESLRNCHFFNNVGEGDPLVDPDGAEHQVEGYFAAQGQELLKKHTPGVEVGAVYQQLPVGLFNTEAHQERYTDKIPHAPVGVFPGGRAATDLWGLSRDRQTLIIYELKATQNSGKANKAAGIISELMFYCNYAYDMYIADNNFKPSFPKDVGVSQPRSGYLSLLDACKTSPNPALTGVRGYFLTDKLHPLITPKVLAEMSRSGIKYQAILYKRNGSEIVI